MTILDPLASGQDAEQIDEFIFSEGSTRAAPPDNDDDDDGDGDGGDDGGGDDWDPHDGPFPLMAPDRGDLEPIIGGADALRDEFPFQVQLSQSHPTPERAQSNSAQADNDPTNLGDVFWDIDTAGLGGGGDDDVPTTTGCILWDIDTAGLTAGEVDNRDPQDDPLPTMTPDHGSDPGNTSADIAIWTYEVVNSGDIPCSEGFDLLM